MATEKSTPARRATSKPAPPPLPAKRKTVAKAAAASPGTGTPPAPAEVAKVKHKLVRDSFTIPKGEYAALDELKQRATRLARPAKKGELIRAGIVSLSGMSDAVFLATLKRVPNLKTGRPKDAKPAAAKAAVKKA